MPSFYIQTWSRCISEVSTGSFTKRALREFYDQAKPSEPGAIPDHLYNQCQVLAHKLECKCCASYDELSQGGEPIVEDLADSDRDELVKFHIANKGQSFAAQL